MDLEMEMPNMKRKDTGMDESSKEKKPKTDLRIPEKSAVLIGLKHPDPEKNTFDVKNQILRMKDMLINLRGFSEDNITLIIEDDDQATDDTKPTSKNIRDKVFFAVETAVRGDIIFIHLIAHGCSPGFIRDADKDYPELIGDAFFRALISSACVIGCQLTVVSDCLIESSNVCKYPIIPKLNKSVKDNKVSGSPKVRYTYRAMTNTTLKPVIVDINSKEEKTENSSTTSSLPDSPPVVLLTPFQCDLKPPPDMDDFQVYLPQELFLLPPKGVSQTYGGFTNVILDIIEETHGQVTNLQLAQKAMEKLPAVPGLSCNHHQYANASFVC